MNIAVVARKPIPEETLERYKLRPLFQRGRKYLLLVEDLKSFIDFLLEENLVEEILHKDRYINVEDYLQWFLDNLIETQKVLGVKYQKIFSPDGEVVGAEFFCNFPIHPNLLMKALKEPCFADMKCLRSILQRVRERNWDKLIFFNTFPRSVEKSDFIVTVVSLVSNWGVKERFVIEILEYQLEEEKVRRNIQFARQNGLKVAVDDWGSESAGIFRIVSLKPDFVKIDKSITWNKEARELVEPIIPKFQEKGIKVIVEGIENEEHYQWAKKLNAYMQGFYLHKPEPF